MQICDTRIFVQLRSDTYILWNRHNLTFLCWHKVSATHFVRTIVTLCPSANRHTLSHICLHGISSYRDTLYASAHYVRTIGLSCSPIDASCPTCRTALFGPDMSDRICRTCRTKLEMSGRTCQTCRTRLIGHVGHIVPHLLDILEDLIGHVGHYDRGLLREALS